MKKRMMLMRVAVVAGAMMFAVAHPAAELQQQAAQTQQAQQRPFAAFRLSGPTFFADGKTRGGSVGLPSPFFFNQPIEFFQYSGKTLCMAGSATRTAPTDAGYGWRVMVLPAPSRTSDGIELDVEWERRWERGAAVNGPRGKSRVSLHAGDKVILDYIPAGSATPGCDAIGMGLQIEMLATSSPLGEIVEADLWLVKKSDNTTIERQTIRLQPGEPVPFFFKDLAVAINGPIKIDATYYFQNKTANPSLIVRTAGRLTPTVIKGERVTATIELSQGVVALGTEASIGIASRPNQDSQTALRLAAAKVAFADNERRGYKPEHPMQVSLQKTIQDLTAQVAAEAKQTLGSTTQRGALYDLMARRGGATFEFTAVPSEVVEFQVPELSGGERLVVRVQMRVLGK